jgi:hypothetical protein
MLMIFWQHLAIVLKTLPRFATPRQSKPKI